MKPHPLLVLTVLSLTLTVSSEQMLIKSAFAQNAVSEPKTEHWEVHAHHHLVQKGAPDVTANASGSWFDPTNWSTGQVPAAGSNVLIPAGFSLTYDAVSDVALGQVSVEGTLQFSTTQSSRLVLDTLTVDAAGLLLIGQLSAPIAANVQVEILIADNGNLDPAGDPALMGRGVVASGEVRIHGAAKTVHGKVAVDPVAGDTAIQMAQAPVNWEVGDTLVIAGTHYSGWRWDNSLREVRYFGTEDEVVTVTAVVGAQVSFTPALVYSHGAPRADLKTSVANYSRNVTIATQNPQVSRERRGHVMFVNNDNIDVRYAAFQHLGRTSKAFLSLEAADFGSIAADSNVRGRYPFHIHRAGISDPRNPAVVIGNAVFDSPGWGYVHHDSNAIFHNNASFDTFGAGFVAETGNEIGSWTHNIAIKAEGNRAFNPKNGNDVELFDMGRTGDGFWFQGRMVKSVGNIAASVNHGFVYLHRGAGMLGFDNQAFTLPEALRRNGQSAPDDAPILGFHGNESFASTVGLYVVKANPNQQHDIHSHLTQFLAWEVQAGAALEYTSHYLLEDFDVVGKAPEPFSEAAFGIDFGTNTSDMVIHRATITNFETGIGLAKDFTDPNIQPDANQYVTIDITMNDVANAYENYDPALDQLLTSADLVPGRFQVNLDNLPLEFLSPATSAGSGVVYTGSKQDSIGSTPIPGGTDSIGTPVFDMITICAEDGYYRTAGGDAYAVEEEYFTDRATGQVHKMGLKTRLGPQVDNLLGNQFFAWSDAFQRGTIDLASLPPVAVDDVANTSTDQSVVINLVSNDSDPEGNPISVDGLLQPIHGLVFDNGDGTVLYRPDYDFVGTDSFRYWASDNQGNFTPATVTVAVGPVRPDPLFLNGFER
ncbi:MAG: cadherin-like domain-containing protein [Lysobacterales bacterium]